MVNKLLIYENLDDDVWLSVLAHGVVFWTVTSLWRPASSYNLVDRNRVAPAVISQGSLTKKRFNESSVQ